MRTRKVIIRFLAASLALFLATLTGTGWSLSPSPAGESNTVSFSVHLQEWFVLEVQTPETDTESAGTSGASVTATMSPNGMPSRVRALAAVGSSQAVELRVQVFGDPADSSGMTLPLSEVSWEGSGEGFLSGRFTNSGTAVIALWMGSGYHEGTVRYLSPQDSPIKKNYVQRVVYSLIAT